MYVTINADGSITQAPRTLTDGAGRVHYHPPDAMYEEAGYLARVDTAAPESGENETAAYISRYIEQGGQAVQVWEATERVEPIMPTPTIEERVTNLEQTVDTMLTGGEAM